MKPSRYVFDHRARKIDCPACGHRTFRTYLDSSTGQGFDTMCGICDRENSCGHKYTPWEYNRDRGFKDDYRPVNLPPPKMKSTAWRCPPEIVAKTMDHRGNVFAKWLVGHFGDKAKGVLKMYRVGTYPLNGKVEKLRGAIVYWNIGQDGLPRSGKVMAYGPDGKRRKDAPPQWMHTLVYGKSSDELGIGQVMFGAHLIHQNPDKEVCVVESEKSALICACVWPDKVWVATGGSDSFMVSRCQDLVGRKVWVFPDAGMWKKWLAKSLDIEVMCESMVVSDILEAMGAPEGDDIADYILPEWLLGDVNPFPWAPEPELPVEPVPIAAKVEMVTKSPVQRIFEKPELANFAKVFDFDIEGATIRPLT